jgi:CSLREA domain-containing protein
MRKCVRVLVGLVLLLCVPGSGKVAAAYSWVVNTTADHSDAYGCEHPPGDCTLREAIEGANSSVGSDTILFDIPPGDTGCDGVACTITLTSALPALNDPADDAILIDGTSQPDTNPNGPDIAVNGASTYDCFVVESANNTITGLVMNQCGHGVEIIGADAHHNTIAGNYIGINAQGSAALGNTYDGVAISGAHDNTVGGLTADDRNVISGNQFHGILILGSGADSNIVYGNYIGTNANGTASVANVFNGVKIDEGAQSNWIGGSLATQRNVISGNGHGVLIAGSGTDGNVVEGNYIGTDLTGTQALANAHVGVYIDAGAKNNVIGRLNLIAFNGEEGVRVNGASTDGNKITKNLIHSNGSKGIALLGGANGGILPPTITAADCKWVVGTAALSDTVEVFSDLNVQGREFECETLASPKPEESSVLFICETVNSIFMFPMLTATATDLGKNTSEFSTPPYPNGCQFVHLPLVMKNY